MISRKINWVSSLQSKNDEKITQLEHQLANFYRSNENYYEDIDFTSDHWVNKAEKAYVKMLQYAKEATSICEFGCGSANILKFHNDLWSKYSACDFSDVLISNNQRKYPSATFKTIETPGKLPFEANKFDLVFSVFVLEHCCRPNQILDECNRVLLPGGRLVILCPDFLGKGKMSSQRAGFSEGTSKSKLNKGRIFDALVTLFDNRIRIPFYSWQKRLSANKAPRFLINITPTVFEDSFIADVDAVYLTYRNEIINYMADNFVVEENSEEIKQYEKERGLIFISLKKNR
jgi:ubiquinone/menaquinone biosynthesis C-methylase UbiE